MVPGNERRRGGEALVAAADRHDPAGALDVLQDRVDEDDARAAGLGGCRGREQVGHDAGVVVFVFVVVEGEREFFFLLEFFLFFSSTPL